MHNISTVMRSNLYTMTVAASQDERQRPAAAPYTMPNQEERLLRARLILEEALETVAALGFVVQIPGDVEPLKRLGGGDRAVDMGTVRFVPGDAPYMNEIIDGCVDTVYVCIGTLAKMGVPDLPHIDAVLAANDAKFPNGRGVAHPTVPGKYGKPPGWVPPDHLAVSRFLQRDFPGLSLRRIGEMLVENEQARGA